MEGSSRLSNGVQKRLADTSKKLSIELATKPSTAVLVTMVDLVRKYTFIGLAASKQADDVSAVIAEHLQDLKGIIKIATYDNEKKFSYHDEILEIDFYFPRPYHSWERGLNEKTNGLIRQSFPKRSDFKDFTPEDILRV